MDSDRLPYRALMETIKCRAPDLVFAANGCKVDLDFKYRDSEAPVREHIILVIA